MTLELRNPHSVLAALKHRPHDIREIRCSSANPGGAWDEVLIAAQQAGISLSVSQRQGNSKRQRGHNETERSSGTVAMVKERQDFALKEILPSEGNTPKTGLWLALDCLQDPQNVGAIFRSAAFFGVQGIILTKDRSAPMNSTVYDVSAGGVEAMPFSVVTNLTQALKTAKEAGLWVLGTSEHAQKDISQIDRGRPWLLVIGNEQKGIRRLTGEQCDEICLVTPKGEVSSLNASVAAGVLMSELSSISAS
ncbi:MAG: 23S rRNA (guanosine(2251)-2'-O)-methyltransferase RlmB [Planctomycetaceae bacterium]|jgi:23S rRNA (guanosine2251-2'-O)-methyltransferase|nr:23S rRNA (guanosine(2251)-2'-O)-methyltransferase RlmB [Planctomycetaceae bacterium]